MRRLRVVAAAAALAVPFVVTACVSGGSTPSGATGSAVSSSAAPFAPGNGASSAAPVSAQATSSDPSATAPASAAPVRVYFVTKSRTVTSWGARAEYPAFQVEGGDAATAAAITRDVNGEVSAVIDRFVANSEEMHRQSPDSGYGEYLTATDWVRWNRYLSIRFGESAQTGGVHPNNASRALVYDLRDGSRVDVPSVFMDPDKVLTLIRAAMQAQVKPGQTLDPDEARRIAFVPLDTDKVPLTCGFGPAGMYCVVDQGTVTAHALGEFSATLPWATVLPLFKPGTVDGAAA